MELQRFLLVFLSLLGTISGISAFNVRVLLDVQPCGRSASWLLCSESGFSITCKARAQRFRFPGKRLPLSGVHTGVMCNQTLINGDRICITPDSEPFTFGDKQYAGNIEVVLQHGKAYLVNSVDLEDYIFAVLRWEGWPGWPLEIDKAFAIMIRTYVMWQVLESRKTNKPYHIKNNNHHQCYDGLHSRHVLRKAVEETAHTFLAFDGKPILAMFDSCCGGVIPAKVLGMVDFAKAPYLARTYPCTYCKSYKIYSWEFELKYEHLAPMLCKALGVKDTLLNVQVARFDDAGVVQEVVIKGAKKVWSLTAKQWYSLFKEVKSFCFSIAHTVNTIIVTGRGYGHHMGLCQWGAREMVRQGWLYDEILQFYYPGTSFMRLEHTGK